MAQCVEKDKDVADESTMQNINWVLFGTDLHCFIDDAMMWVRVMIQLILKFKKSEVVCLIMTLLFPLTQIII